MRLIRWHKPAITKFTLILHHAYATSPVIRTRLHNTKNEGDAFHQKTNKPLYLNFNQNLIGHGQGYDEFLFFPAREETKLV